MVKRDEQLLQKLRLGFNFEFGETKDTQKLVFTAFLFDAQH